MEVPDLSKDTQLNPVKVSCECGCAMVGAARSKNWGDGKVHVRGCACHRCRGSRNRSSGLKKQRAARKLLDVPAARFHGELGNEESWRFRFRVEVKSGQVVQSMATRYLAAERQSFENKAIGDPRLFVFVAMPGGWGNNDGLVTMRLSTWNREIAPHLPSVD
jgi:hypothetical protein